MSLIFEAQHFRAEIEISFRRPLTVTPGQNFSLSSSINDSNKSGKASKTSRVNEEIFYTCADCKMTDINARHIDTHAKMHIIETQFMCTCHGLYFNSLNALARHKGKYFDPAAPVSIKVAMKGQMPNTNQTKIEMTLKNQNLPVDSYENNQDVINQLSQSAKSKYPEAAINSFVKKNIINPLDPNGENHIKWSKLSKKDPLWTQVTTFSVKDKTTPYCKCYNCGDAEILPTHVKYHAKLHFAQKFIKLKKDKNFLCNLCGMYFGTAVSLKNHTKKCQNSNIRVKIAEKQGFPVPLLKEPKEFEAYYQLYGDFGRKESIQDEYKNTNSFKVVVSSSSESESENEETIVSSKIEFQPINNNTAMKAEKFDLFNLSAPVCSNFKNPETKIDVVKDEKKPLIDPKYLTLRSPEVDLFIKENIETIPIEKRTKKRLSYLCKKCLCKNLPGSGIRAHALLHFQTKGFKCNHCNLYLSTDPALSAHIAKHHPETTLLNKMTYSDPLKKALHAKRGATQSSKAKAAKSNIPSTNRMNIKTEHLIRNFGAEILGSDKDLDQLPDKSINTPGIGATAYQIMKTPETYTKQDIKNFIANNMIMYMSDSPEHKPERFKHLTVVKVYKCKICNRDDIQPTGLHVHAKTHLNQFGKPCYICKMKFKSYTCFREHYATVHKTDLPKLNYNDKIIRLDESELKSLKSKTLTKEQFFSVTNENIEEVVQGTGFFVWFQKNAMKFHCKY